MTPPVIPVVYRAAWVAVDNAWRFAQDRLLSPIWKTWLGYGFGGPLDDPTIALFLAPGPDRKAVLDFVQRPLDRLRPSVRLAAVGIDRFAAVPGRRRPVASGEVRPGHGVEALGEGPACSDADVGTIGAILTVSHAPNDRWILSNHHVLARRHDCRFDGQGHPRKFRTVVGNDTICNPGAATADLQTIEIQQSGNRLDACAVKLLDPHAAVVNYSPMVVANPAVPIRPNTGDQVEKLGSMSQLTSARVEFSSATVRIELESSGFSGAELIDQVLVGLDDASGHPFFKPGDSGSLVVHHASHRPVGILVGGGTREEGQKQLTVVSPLDTILGSIHPPGGAFSIMV
jgi:hypothetical protein